MRLRNLCLMLAATLPCLAAGAVPAIAQRVQFAPQTAYSRLDKLSARVEAVRYENVTSNRPFVIVYLMVRNESTTPVLLGANTFEGTRLAVGSTVHSGVGHSFPHGFGAGEEGKLETKTLASYSTYRIAFRYQLSGSVPTAPLRLILREKPLLKLLGRPAGGETTLNVDGYAGAPASPPPLKTPPQMALYPGRLQVIRYSDASFRALGPFRARIDEVAYGNPADRKNVADHVFVKATVQNTLSVPVTVRDEAFSGTVISERGPNVRSGIPYLENGTYHRSLILGPGEWLYVSTSNKLPNEEALRAVRRFSFSYSPSDQAGGTFTVDLPRFTALTQPEPEARKQAAASAPETPAAASAGDFRKTAYMDVRLDGLKKGKFGEGVEVTVTVRNKIGRRLGMQHDWQNYTVLGSDGEEYRTDGNHYGASRTDRLANTVWLENDQEAKRTHVFPRLPFGETATRLIIREYGKEVASFDLPK